MKIVKTKTAESYMSGTPAYNVNSAKYKSRYSVEVNGEEVATIEPSVLGGYSVRATNKRKLFGGSLNACRRFVKRNWN